MTFLHLSVDNVSQENTYCHWLDPSEVWGVTGGHYILLKTSVVATFAQTSKVSPQLIINILVSY